MLQRLLVRVSCESLTSLIHMCQSALHHFVLAAENMEADGAASGGGPCQEHWYLQLQC